MPFGRRPVGQHGPVTAALGRVRSWLHDPVHRWLVAIVLVGFALRAGWALAVLDSLPRVFASGDQYGYVRYGREIAAGEGYVSYTAGTPTAYYPIGYPALLAVIFWVAAQLPFGVDLPDLIGLVHAALGTVVIAGVWLLGRRALGTAPALVAAALVALHPDLIALTASFALETAFLGFALGALGVIAGHDWGSGPPSRSRVLTFAGVLALTTLIRPFALPFVIALAVAVLLTGAGWRRVASAVGWVLLVVALVLAPWTIRNWVRLDAFVPLSTNLGDTACISRVVGSDGGFAWASHEGCAEPTLPDVERNAENLRLAVAFVREHPDEELRLIGRRLQKMFEHGHPGILEAEASGRGPLDDGVAEAVRRASDAWLVGLLVLGVPGLLLACRRWREQPGRAFIVLPAAILFVIPLGLWGNPRFAIPLAPFLALGAGALVGVVTGALGRRGRRSTPEPAQ